MMMLRTLLIALLALGGCTWIDPDTKSALDTFSPLHADPAAFEFTLDLPAGLAVPPGVPKFTLAAERPDTGARIDETMLLDSVATTVGPDGNSLITYRFRAADVARLRAAQAKAITWEQETGGAAKGSISLDMSACRVGDGPAKGETTSVTLRTSADGPTLPLITDMPVAQLVSQTAWAATDMNTERCAEIS